MMVSLAAVETSNVVERRVLMGLFESLMGYLLLWMRMKVVCDWFPW